MQIITFIKALRIKGKIYNDVWLPILFSLEEKGEVKINRRLDISKSQHYRIISYGIELWNKVVSDVFLESKYGKIYIVNNIKKTTKKKTQKTKKENPKVVNSDVNMDEVYSSIIDYLNLKANTGYQSKTNSYRKFIDARLNDGYKLDDFYKVIDNKCSEWINTDFQKFLRPETLFGNKFDSYLNQNLTIKNKQETAYEQVSKATELGWNSNT